MKYVKPEIAVLESASSAIRGLKQAVLGPDSNTTQKHLSIASYEADE